MILLLSLEVGFSPLQSKWPSLKHPKFLFCPTSLSFDSPNFVAGGEEHFHVRLNHLRSHTATLMYFSVQQIHDRIQDQIRGPELELLSSTAVPKVLNLSIEN